MRGHCEGNSYRTVVNIAEDNCVIVPSYFSMFERDLRSYVDPKAPKLDYIDEVFYIESCRINSELQSNPVV